MLQGFSYIRLTGICLLLLGVVLNSSAQTLFTPSPQSPVVNTPPTTDSLTQTEVVGSTPSLTPQSNSLVPNNGQQAGVVTPVTPATQVVNQADGTQVIIATVYCPKPSELFKNGLFWGTATGNWKSYGESFDTSIIKFLGAQWVGVNVGKMICIYKGNLSMSFPIMVQNDTLTQTPTGGLWGQDQGGYQNCHSTNIWDCPFVIKSTVVNMQQIYQSLDFFKGKPNPLTYPNQ